MMLRKTRCYYAPPSKKNHRHQKQQSRYYNTVMSFPQRSHTKLARSHLPCSISAIVQAIQLQYVQNKQVTDNRVIIKQLILLVYITATQDQFLPSLPITPKLRKNNVIGESLKDIPTTIIHYYDHSKSNKKKK